VVATADVCVGSLLYQQVSVLLGLLLLICGFSVLVVVASEPLSRVVSKLHRYRSGERVE
jgi:hypothetical protein